MIKAVIIDDEKKARNFIESIVRNNFQEIAILAKASSVVEGIKAIAKNKPDIVFLDIEMQDGNGFDVLEGIPERDFDFIFITAYDQYAIKAFKYSAVDYILKPIDVNEFITSIKRILLKRSEGKSSGFDNYKILKENINSQIPSKLAIPYMKGFEYIKVSEIVRFEADGRYTHIYLINGRKLTVSKTIGEYGELINDKTFYKPHKSHLINLNYVKKYVRQDGGFIIMEDDSSVAIARNQREEFIEIMANIDI